MSPLSEEVRALLDRIPHRDCGAINGTRFLCNCDREVRVAEAVTEAIHVAYREGTEAALSVLRKAGAQ